MTNNRQCFPALLLPVFYIIIHWETGVLYAEKLSCRHRNLRGRICAATLTTRLSYILLGCCGGPSRRWRISCSMRKETTPRPSYRIWLLCRVCCSFLALHFAPHFSYYTSLPPKVVFMLYSEFLGSNILKEISICLVLHITVYYNTTCRSIDNHDHSNILKYTSTIILL